MGRTPYKRKIDEGKDGLLDFMTVIQFKLNYFIFDHI